MGPLSEITAYNVIYHPKAFLQTFSVYVCWETPSFITALFDCQAFIEREHEFRFVQVIPVNVTYENEHYRPAVLCCRYTDEGYRAKRCPPEEFQSRYGQFGIDHIFRYG